MVSCVRRSSREFKKFLGVPRCSLVLLGILQKNLGSLRTKWSLVTIIISFLLLSLTKSVKVLLDKSKYTYIHTYIVMINELNYLTVREPT